VEVLEGKPMSKFTVPPDVVDALRRGNKIEAIKRLREASGLGLAEAKGVLDRLEGGAHAGQSAHPTPTTFHHAHPVQPGQSGLSPGEVPRGKEGAFAIGILIAAAVAGLWAYVMLS
jgi:hypothetical protein